VRFRADEGDTENERSERPETDLRRVCALPCPFDA
jgi:hypothetical protein